MSNDGMEHMDYLEAVAASDVAALREKEATYRGSWKRGGGRSAWFMLRRKIDRLLNMMARPATPSAFDLARVDAALNAMRNLDHLPLGPKPTAAILQYLRDSYVAENVFAKVREAPGGEDGTVLAEVRDLRRYLMLVEAEIAARGVVVLPAAATHATFVVGVDPAVEGSDTVVITEERLVPRFHSTVGPGTPEDGGHHAEVRRGVLPPERPWDGMLLKDGPPLHWAYRRSYDPEAVGGQGDFYIVDRENAPLAEWDHLPRLALEVNAVEYREMEPWYRGLYLWSEAEVKYKMLSPFVEYWGKEP